MVFEFLLRLVPYNSPRCSKSNVTLALEHNSTSIVEDYETNSHDSDDKDVNSTFADKLNLQPTLEKFLQAAEIS